MKPGQPVEVSLDLYPGQIFAELALSTQLLTNAEGMQYGHGHLFTPSHKLMAPCDHNGQIATRNANFEQTSNVSGGNARSEIKH